MNKKRICLIVDNPIRDLDGMVLLAWTLAQEGLEVFLVPMYSQFYEIAALAPDMVLVNYLRPNNKHLVQAYKNCGILVGVLDTEGGILNDIEEELTNLVLRSNPENVDLYCFWGKMQYDSFVKNNVLPTEKMKVTGCPRYDFCSTKWKGALENLEESNKMILVNTRFSLIFPRFNKRIEDEVKTMLDLGFTDDFVRESMRQCFLVWAEMVKTVSDLARKFSEAAFVVRPHPFEQANIYKTLFADLKNVKVIQKGPSLPWIKAAKVLIQRDCSTAVEASFLDVAPLSLEWIEASHLNNPVVSSVSHHVKKKQDIFGMIETLLRGEKLPGENDIIQIRDGIVNEWFYAIDGNSSKRVADAILETLAGQKHLPDKRKLLKTFISNIFSKKGIRGFHGYFGRRVLGTSNFYKIKSSLLNKPSGLAKEFSKKDVIEIVKRIDMTANSEKSIKVEKVSNRDMQLKTAGKYSIKISL